jgi:hypothetical protein
MPNIDQSEPNPFSIEFKLRNSFENITFNLESYVANGPPRSEVPGTLKFTPLNSRNTSNVIFDMPHQDRLHTILLRYRDTKNENIGFDVSIVIRLQGLCDKNNGFKHAKQTTIVHYIGSQENYDSNVIKTKFVTFYSRDNSNRVRKMSKGPEYSQEHRLLRYIVKVEHSYKSPNLLNFDTTIHILPRKDAMKSKTSNRTSVARINNDENTVKYQPPSEVAS